MMKNALFIIDNQVDFCDPKGNLYVPGAEATDRLLSEQIRNNIGSFDYICATQDQHQPLHIAHTVPWEAVDGNPISFFSTVGLSGTTFTATAHVPMMGRTAGEQYEIFPIPQYKSVITNYISQLQNNGEYPHTFWPMHCLVGSPGAAFMPGLCEALVTWQTERKLPFQIARKGEYPFAEHFGALRANVQIPGQPSTELNDPLINKLSTFNRVYFCGEARNYCVANTLKQLLDYAPQLVRKLWIVRDCMHDVPIPHAVDRADGIFAKAEGEGANIIQSHEMFNLATV